MTQSVPRPPDPGTLAPLPLCQPGDQPLIVPTQLPGVADDADLLARMRRHSVGWRYPDLVRLLRRSGFVEVSRRGSHRRWKHSGGAFVTLVDAPGEVLPVYVRQTFAAIARTGESR